MTAAASVRPVSRYRVTCGLESDEMSDLLARALWDAHPEGLRSGEREGAFILWRANERGMRCAPVLFRPMRGEAP